MYVFSATMTAAPGRTREARELIPQFRDAGIAAHGIPTSAWAFVAGAPHGTYALTARIENTDQLLEGLAKLDANEAWNDLGATVGGAFAAPAETGYVNVVAQTAEEIPQPPLLSVTRALAAPGKVQAAVGGAVQVLEFVKREAGIDGVLTMSAAGPMNQISWIFGIESGAQGDSVQETLAANPAWLELTDSIGVHFESGSGERFLLARI